MPVNCLRKALPTHLGCSSYARLYSSGNVSVSDFASRKKGTGKGPFVELPDFKPLQDSILVKIPSSCTVYGNMDKINAISPDPNADGQPFLAQEYDSIRGFSKILTGQYPANLIMSSSTPMSSVSVVKVDSYKNGLFVPCFRQSVLCYSGDLFLDKDNQLKGLGVVALAGMGPVYKLKLEKYEHIMVSGESILAYDSHVKLNLTRLKSSYGIPKILNDFFSKYLHHYYDVLQIQWSKIFSRDKIYCNVQGPGTFFLQTNFIPGSKKYSNDEFMETL